MILLLLVALVLVPAVAQPQGDPLGPEFRVNTFTNGKQYLPAVTADGSNGTFVVVWESFLQDGSGWGVFGQRYLPSGVPSGGEFRVNTYTTDDQTGPSVAADTAGNFVVVWTSDKQDDPIFSGVFGQRYSATGAALGPEFRVNTFTPSGQVGPAAAWLPTGFVVAWASLGQDGANLGVFGQRYAETGDPVGPEFQVNTYTKYDQLSPRVAAIPTGEFVVVWTSQGDTCPGCGGQDGSSDGVFGQRYASSGAPAGPEFRVNTYTTSAQLGPSVAAYASGFVVVWTSSAQDGPFASGVFGQRYAASGAPLGPEFRVNTYTTDAQHGPSVAADFAGNFVVTWTTVGQDGPSAAVFGQRYASSGEPVGLEFRVNSYTTGAQDSSSVAAAGSPGAFMVVWTSDLQDGSSDGIFGQRFAMTVPVELIRFGVE
jgi:hypothetical protein